MSNASAIAGAAAACAFARRINGASAAGARARSRMESAYGVSVFMVNHAMGSAFVGATFPSIRTM